MKRMQYFRNIIMVFWYGWFAIAGILATVCIVGLSPTILLSEDIIVTGATIGIITGGLAALMLFLLNCRKHGSSYMDDHPVIKFLRKHH